MVDSLFTSINFYDDQIGRFDRPSCAMLSDALARRMAKLDGPTAAAVKFQRIADVCSSAHVMPIDHWRNAGKATEITTATEPGTTRRRLAQYVVGRWWIYWAIGFVSGVVVIL